MTATVRVMSSGLRGDEPVDVDDDGDPIIVEQPPSAQERVIARRLRGKQPLPSTSALPTPPAEDPVADPAPASPQPDGMISGSDGPVEAGPADIAEPATSSGE